MDDQQTIDRPPTGGSAASMEPPRNTSLVIREPDMKWLDIPREELVPTLMRSLYPGAKAESVNSVLDYCYAARLNVMLKPVHIVPMNVKVGQNKWEWRDVVMPGINHYRTQASRTGTYVGKSEPEWGPLVEKTWGDIKLTVPEWCRITVKRLVGGHIAEFTAEEYWDENFANAGRDKPWPNAMWLKRSKGQLHKCTEAQALRMAFPELISDVTAEEMEGKTIDLTAEEVERKPAAVRSLDAFAGGGNVENSDHQGGQENRQEPEDAVVEEPVDVAPIMPAEILNAFIAPKEGAKPDWKPGWRWINETIEGGNFTQGAKQEVAAVYKDLLWAVYGVGGKQKTAVLEFVEKHGMVVPQPDKVMGDAEKE